MRVTLVIKVRALRKPRLLGLVAVLLVAATGCSPSSSRSSSEIRAIRMKRYLLGLPVSFKFPVETKGYTVGAGELPLTPVTDGTVKFSKVEWSISPALPAGLNFDLRTGTISGTPVMPSSQRSYLVTLIGDGTPAATGEIRIGVIDLAPAIFHYGEGLVLDLPRLTLHAGQAPQFETGGGVPVSFVAHPPLPMGLLLDSVTGALTGAPSVASAFQNYTVTAVNSGGERDRVLSIRVHEPLPTKPTDLISLPGNGLGTLTWTAPNQLAGSLEALSFSVERRSPAGSGAWTVVVNFYASNGFVDFGLVNGQEYEYRVIARHSGGLGKPSDPVLMVPESPPQPSVSAASTSVERGLPMDPTIEFLPHATEAPLGACSVAPALPAGILVEAVASIRGCRISGNAAAVSASKTYTLTAQNFGGTGTVTFDLGVRDPVPGVPTGFLAEIPTATSVRLLWSDPSDYETGFAIQRSDDGGATFTTVGTVAPNVTEFVDAGLTPMVTVYYRVKTLAVEAESPPTGFLAIAPMARPVAPTITFAGSLTGGISLEWGPIAGPGTIRYEIRKDGSVLATVPSTQTSFSELNLISGVAHTYEVYALNEAGSSPASSSQRLIASMPIEISYSLIAVGASHTCRIRVNQGGTVECWGSNSHGQLGGGVVGQDSASPVTVTGVVNAISVAAGESHSCALLFDTSVKCWGNQYRGRLGNGQSSAGAVLYPVAVMGEVGETLLSDVRDISAGGQHSCATLSSGRVYCWGSNLYGQLGLGLAPGQLLEASKPKPLSLTGVVHVRTSLRHSCALLATSEVSCWGNNANGGLGDGTTTQRVAPVVVLESASKPFGMLGFREVSLGQYFSCARYLDGTARCWGRNLEGQLGDDSTVNRYYPVAVRDLAGIRNLRSGSSSSCAIRLDSSASPAQERVTCWGANSLGELATGNQNPSGVAMDSVLSWDAPQSGDPIPDLAMSAVSSHAYLTESTGKLWGSNSASQLGTQSVSLYETIPVPAP